MITAIFMVYFLNTSSVQFISDQTIFNTVEECQAYSKGIIEMQKGKMAAGESEPHTATYRCVDWANE